MVALLCEHCNVCHITQENAQGMSPIVLAENRGRTRMVRDMLAVYKRRITKNPYLANPRLTELAEKYSK